MEAFRAAPFGSRAKGGKERQEVVFFRVGEHGIGRLAAVIEQLASAPLIEG